MDIIAANILNSHGKTGARLAGAALALSILSLVVLASAGPGYRFEFWEFRTGFAVLRWAAYGAVLASALSALAIALNLRGPRRTLRVATAGFLIGLFVIYVPVSWKMKAGRVPAIHDITTDTENPPAFSAVLDERKGAPNPAEYGGPVIAAIQRAAYPDIAPIRLSSPPDVAFDRAFLAARTLGWRIVALDDASGMIEATDTTFWFGFRDDIVVRITPDDGGSRVDVRSVSRVGKSDVGTNAERIRAFRKRLTRR